MICTEISSMDESLALTICEPEHASSYEERRDREHITFRDTPRWVLRRRGGRPPRLHATTKAPKHAHLWVRSIERSLPKHRRCVRDGTTREQLLDMAMQYLHLYQLDERLVDLGRVDLLRDQLKRMGYRRVSEVQGAHVAVLAAWLRDQGVRS